MAAENDRTPYMSHRTPFIVFAREYNGFEMRKASWMLIPAAIAAVVAAVSLYSQGRSGPVQRAMPAGASFLISLGVGDKASTPWDGSITVSPGGIASIRGWRFVAGDSTDSVSSWKCSIPRRRGRPTVIRCCPMASS